MLEGLKSISLVQGGNVGVMAGKGQTGLTFFSAILLPREGPQHLQLTLWLAGRSIGIVEEGAIFKGSVSDMLEPLGAGAIFLIYVLHPHVEVIVKSRSIGRVSVPYTCTFPFSYLVTFELFKARQQEKFVLKADKFCVCLQVFGI